MSRAWEIILLVACACAGPTPSPTSPPTSAQVGESERPCEHLSDVRVRGECLDPTGARDAAPALARIIGGAPSSPAGLGTPIALPENAVLRLDDADGDGVALRIDRRVIIEARGAVLRATGDFVALRLIQAAHHSTLRDLTIEGRGRDRGGVGLDVRTHGLRIDNMWVRQIGIAVRAHTRLEVGGECSSADDCHCADGHCQCRDGRCLSYANENAQRWENILISACRTGITFRGSDTNAGVITGVEVASTPDAIDDRSFLGNVWIGPEVATATERSIGLGGSAQYSTVVGAYIEQNSAHATGPARSLFVGGNAVRFLDGPAERVGMRSAQLAFWHPETRLRVTIPGGADSAFTWEHPSEGARWHLRLFEGSRWGFSQTGSPARTFYLSDVVPGLVEWRQRRARPRDPPLQAQPVTP